MFAESSSNASGCVLGVRHLLPITMFMYLLTPLAYIVHLQQALRFSQPPHTPTHSASANQPIHQLPTPFKLFYSLLIPTITLFLTSRSYEARSTGPDIRSSKVAIWIDEIPIHYLFLPSTPDLFGITIHLLFVYYVSGVFWSPNIR